MPRISLKDLNEADQGEPSAAVRDRVTATQSRQLERQGVLNAKLAGDASNTHASLSKTVCELLESASEQLGLSTRACHRVQRLTRTIADLAGAQTVVMQHLAEAIQYRQLDHISLRQGGHSLAIGTTSSSSA